MSREVVPSTLSWSTNNPRFRDHAHVATVMCTRLRASGPVPHPEGVFGIITLTHVLLPATDLIEEAELARVHVALCGN